jgi:hypothetical protein
VALLDHLADLLEKSDVAFALIGAEAVAARGVPRATFDIDLFTVDVRVLREEFWSSLSHAADIEIRRGDFDDPLRGVVRIHVVGEPSIDLVVGRWKWEQKMVERAELLSSLRIRVVTTSDLILLKLAAGGTQDAWDISRLLAVNGEDVVADVEKGLVDLRLDARELWQRIRRSV